MDYYYIKFKPMGYDDPAYYLCLGGYIKEQPLPLKIFDDLEQAIDYKQNTLPDAENLFRDYEVSIERL